MTGQKRYEKSFKEQAIKLANEIGISRASEKLSVPKSTLAGWIRKEQGQAQKTAEKLQEAEENKTYKELCGLKDKKIKQLEKEIRKLKELNEFLEEASAFFAASRQRLAKKKD